MKQRTYIAIDLKSFYASVECMDRGLDPLTTNLVVADESRTQKTICLAVSPSLKAYGIPGRARLFEVARTAKQYGLTYIAAPPRMARYMEVSRNIYNVYLKYVAPEDIHVYSIDEVMMDVTSYLSVYGLTPKELARKMILDVLSTTGITATAGIGTNLYLCKVAMDIMAKHIPADEYGVRIAELDEMSYRRELWEHRPLTDFWRVGHGIAAKLEANGLFTMGDIARCSVGKDSDFYNEDLLYRLFGINAELLIDHAWGWEPCTMAEVKAYKPDSNSIGSGQVLHCPYDTATTRIVVREMLDQLALNLVEKGLVTDQIILTVGYDIENLTDPVRRKAYKGPVTTDRYGRSVPKHTNGTINLPTSTSSSKMIVDTVLDYYDKSIDSTLLTRRIFVTANHVIDEKEAQKKKENSYEQLSLFTDYQAQEEQKRNEEKDLERERRMQEAMISIQKKFGKNAILKGTNLQEGATLKERNGQIGGHKA